MATPHIEVEDLNLIAKTVLMPGDPLRAKVIAEEYLTDAVLINRVRNMFAYTRLLQGKKGYDHGVRDGDAKHRHLFVRTV